MGVIGIGVGTAKMGRICRDKDGNITEQSTARWDADPAGGSVAIWPMDPEKMEPSGPAEVYGDWDAAAMCGYREPGHVVDKLVREKMLELNGGKHHERNEN